LWFAGTSYKVSVQTSNVNGAGTDAGVYVTLFGENGDSGEIKLVNSETNKKPFENNQLDVFTLPDILNLGLLYKVRVWHDNKG
jgi:lipoxygenase homology domain-containing protein 1